MTIHLPQTQMILVGLLSLVLTQDLSAQNTKSEKEVTWYDALENQRSEIKPRNLELLSIQVSKLPRDTFGHGKTSGGKSFVSSFVVASGTGIYGVFDLDAEGDLKYREELSSLEKFTDDQGKDLTENPSEEKINDFFELNKKLSINLTNNQSKAIFAVRGYSTPTKGAKSLKAKAKIVFLALSQEKSETKQIESFEANQKFEIGPVSLTVHKAGPNSFALPGRVVRTVNPSFGNEKREWALQINPRRKPVKNIELLDDANQVIRTLQGLSFDGKSYHYYLKTLPKQPKSIRVNWYEKWELITVPVEMEATLGL